MPLPTIITTQAQLKVLLALRAKAGGRIGELLVAMGKVTQEAVHAAIQAQKAGNGARLGAILVSMEAISQEGLTQVVEQQTGTPLIDLRHYPVNPAALARIQAPAANMYGCLPVDVIEGQLIVVFAENPEADQLAAVRFACGQNVAAFKATNPTLLTAMVARHYANAANTFVRHTSIDREHYGRLTASVATPAGMFRYLVALAITTGASDIHLRPLPDGTRKVLMRVDGMFRDIQVVTPKDVSALIRHIEILSGIDFFNRATPKEGRLSLDHDGRQIDVRVSVIVGASGDSVVLRLLDPVRFPASLNHLALPKPQLQALTGILMRPHGLLVVVGPTGSGKTTTLYTLLKELHSRNLHIVTAEDPVEYRLSGINQFESTNFAELLPKILRHDPDVVMVGELRDEKTMTMALNAALTGHLVLSTVHANDSASTVHRLLGLGAPMHVLGASLAGILSQRLVRLTCPSCEGTGCGECGQTGYSGRTLAAELAKPKATLSQLTGVPTHAEVARHLEFLGGVTLDSTILGLAQRGKTSWAEAAGLITDPRLLPVELRVAMGYSDVEAVVPLASEV